MGRTLSTLLPGTRARRQQIVAFAEQWRLANDRAAGEIGRLWVVLGDSSAQGIGATGVDRGYVGPVRAWLAERDGVPWRVVNLSRSGALASDVIAEQLPAVGALEPDLVSCAVGTNDLLRRPSGLPAALQQIAASLPAGSLLANLPQGLREGRARAVNTMVGDIALRHHLRLVDLWSTTGGPWRGRFAADLFHPNDVGYRDWVAAFTAALDRA